MEREGYVVGFESFEIVVKRCLECGEYILARKVVLGMTETRFVPHISVRQKVVELLAGFNEWKLTCAVRNFFAELES